MGRAEALARLGCSTALHLAGPHSCRTHRTFLDWKKVARCHPDPSLWDLSYELQGKYSSLCTRCRWLGSPSSQNKCGPVKERNMRDTWRQQRNKGKCTSKSFASTENLLFNLLSSYCTVYNLVLGWHFISMNKVSANRWYLLTLKCLPSASRLQLHEKGGLFHYSWKLIYETSLIPYL